MENLNTASIGSNGLTNPSDFGWFERIKSKVLSIILGQDTRGILLDQVVSPDDDVLNEEKCYYKKSEGSPQLALSGEYGNAKTSVWKTFLKKKYRRL